MTSWTNSIRDLGCHQLDISLNSTQLELLITLECVRRKNISVTYVLIRNDFPEREIISRGVCFVSNRFQMNNQMKTYEAEEDDVRALILL